MTAPASPASTAGIYTYFVVCGPGLEPMLSDEIRALALVEPAIQALEGGVALRGDLTTLYRLNVELGLALKVLVRIGEFTVRRFDALVERVRELPWEAWCTAQTPLALRATCKHSKLYHSGAVMERIAKGMSARFGRDVTLAEADAPEALSVHARIVNDVCTLSIDSSGELLHRRGYRKATAKAPLREDLARALLIASGWDRTATLCDPFAGAGTIALEADWLARAVPPGHLRSFAFASAPNFERARLEAVRTRALSHMRPDGPAIFASDRDPGAVAAARANAERAGSAVRIDEAAMSEAPGLAAPASGPLYVVTNPPYGKRIGHDATVTRLYRALGDRLRGLACEVGLAMTVARPEHAHATRLPLTPFLMTDHGGSKIYFSVFDPRRTHTEHT